jgi:hypothetical protein
LSLEPPREAGCVAPADGAPPVHPPPARLPGAPAGVAVWHTLDRGFRKPHIAVY